MTDRGWQLTYWLVTMFTAGLIVVGGMLGTIGITNRLRVHIDPDTGMLNEGPPPELITRAEREALFGLIGLPLTIFAVIQLFFIAAHERKRRRLARAWTAAQEVGPVGAPGAMVRVTGELARVDHGRWRLQDEAGAIYVAAKTIDIRREKSGDLRPASDDLLKTGIHATLVGQVAFGPRASPHRTTRLILPLSETGSVLCVVRGDTHR